MTNNLLHMKNAQFSLSPINLQYGQTSYADWIFSSFLLNKDKSTLFEMKCDGLSKISFDQIQNKIMAKLLRSPFQHSESSSEAGYKTLYFSDEQTYFLKLEKGKTNDSSSRYNALMYCTDKKFGTDIIKILQDQFHAIETDNIYVISSNSSGLVLSSLGSLKYNFIRDNYEEKVLGGFDHIVTEYNKETPNGRISIVNGIPGSGKTNLLKGIISSVKNSNVVLLPAKFVVELDSPSIVSLLIEERANGYVDDHFGTKEQNKSILFIIEDADDCLVPRDGNNMSTISSLLNYTDGIFGSMLDMRIIATTNADHMDFDKALLRPGRLCAHVKVDALTPEKASSVYKRLSDGKEKTYAKKTTLAEVYADIKGKFENDQIDKKILGF